MLADKTVRSLNIHPHEIENPPPGSYPAFSSFENSKKNQEFFSNGILEDPNKNMM